MQLTPRRDVTLRPDPQCWGHGIWNWVEDGVGTPTANYPFVKEANADALAWGRLLIQTRFVGSVTSGPCTWRQCVRPGVGPDPSIISMSTDLMTGLFVAPKGQPAEGSVPSTFHFLDVLAGFRR
jgi:hypothetical protein